MDEVTELRESQIKTEPNTPEEHGKGIESVAKSIVRGLLKRTP